MIKIARLVDGSFVIGLMFGEDVLVRALQVTMEDVNGGMNIGVRPLLFPFNSDHSGNDVHKNKIVAIADAPPQLATVYNQVINSTNSSNMTGL